MKMIIRQRRLLFALLLTLGVFWIWYSRISPNDKNPDSIALPQAGFQTPDFSLETTDGEVISLSDVSGRPLLINFWASWCPPCRAEMPAIQEVYETYKEQGFLVLAINATNQDNISAATDFIRENELGFPILWDGEGKVSRLYQIQSLPTSFFVYPSGQIAEVVVGGPMAEAMLRIRVERLLEGKP